MSHTPAPWRAVLTKGDAIVECSDGRHFEIGDIPGHPENRANAHLVAAAPELLDALNAAAGYFLNAKIDLETGCKRSAAIATIEGGLERVRAAIEKAEGRP